MAPPVRDFIFHSLYYRVHIKMKKYIISLIREQILSVPWYNNKSDYGTAIFIFYVINEMYGYN